MLGMKLSKRQKKKLIKYALTVLAAAVCLVVGVVGDWDKIGDDLGLSQPSVTAEGELEVHFIDVGNADCILVRQEDKTMLIDAGERKSKTVVQQYLQTYGVEKFDLVIATHPHADHIGGMAYILENYPVERFVMSYMDEEHTPTTASYENMLEALIEKNIPVDEADPGAVYELGTARLQILAPYEPDADANNISVVTRLTFGDKAFLFTGDAETSVEKQLISGDYSLKADVLKLGHHGSNTSNSTAFLRQVAPDFAVITCGENNEYGHPQQEVIDRLTRQEMTVYRADVDGHIVFTTDGATLSVSTRKEE